ncbi:FAD-dependent oxidoreductase [Leucobacter sp. CSA2]|uniref:FAD-dependent oxidoreductase n=1 Tax=Leucobacter edaphi TaxID=2796472 RepID=A0A934QES6_9MICO|nr:FAD-dependent oxidoreductase [Leucobacter edaphi]MBK0422022.1 FAD-dependent oxidoreductase [Leucobacter edaphi]
MARDAGSVLIIGAGLAGFSAATQLRALGHEAPIMIVDSEAGSYDRPPLSKKLFTEDFSLDRLAFATAEELAEKRIVPRFGAAAMTLDPATGEVGLDDGTMLRADTILLATGGRARRLPIPGADLPGVHVLRTWDDAVGLRSAVQPGSRVAVVGAGLIGAELASSLRDAGAEVTLVDPVPVPLVPAIGELLAARLHEMHAPRGIRVVTGMTRAFVEANGALAVEVDGAEGAPIAPIPADVIVVGVGIIPNTGLAEAAGLEVDNGIIVDERYRTSAARVYAAGDVARTRSADGELERREEHWDAAQVSGKRVAAAILGEELPERGASWFWSDRHGIHLEATGRLSGTGEIVVRHGGEHPAVFLIEDGLLRGAAAIDDTQLVRAARRIIDQRIPVAAAELADSNVQLRSLLKAKR